MSSIMCCLKKKSRSPQRTKNCVTEGQFQVRISPVHPSIYSLPLSVRLCIHFEFLLDRLVEPSPLQGSKRIYSSTFAPIANIPLVSR